MQRLGIAHQLVGTSPGMSLVKNLAGRDTDPPISRPAALGLPEPPATQDLTPITRGPKTKSQAPGGRDKHRTPWSLAPPTSGTTRALGPPGPVARDPRAWLHQPVGGHQLQDALGHSHAYQPADTSPGTTKVLKTTNQKFIIDTHKRKKKESKHNTKECPQISREEIKRR